MLLEEFRCKHRLQVRSAEIDAQKIVFNAHYMIYIEETIKKYWKDTYTTKNQIINQEENKLRAQKVCINFQAPAKIDNILDIGVKCIQIDNHLLSFKGNIYLEKNILNTIQIIFALVNEKYPKKQQPLPDTIRKIITIFEAGENMTRLQSGSWNDLGRAADKIRTEVFVHEQKVPREIEIDVLDPLARHIVIFNRLDIPIATARLVSHTPGISRIGRMAVTQELRGNNLGTQMLTALLNEARQRGNHQVILNAQCHAQNFYANAGFVPEGNVFDEAGIAHIQMRKIL